MFHGHDLADYFVVCYLPKVNVKNEWRNAFPNPKFILEQVLLSFIGRLGSSHTAEDQVFPNAHVLPTASTLQPSLRIAKKRESRESETGEMYP